MSGKHSKKKKPKFYRTVISFTVLSEEPLSDSESLSDIVARGMDDCVLGEEIRKEQIMTGKRAARHLYRLGSEPGFFGLNDEGKSIL